MKPARLARGFGAVALILLATCAAEAAVESDRPVDPRSHVVLRLDCESEVSRSDVTLFANGTVRLRRRDGEVEALWLSELTPDEVTGYRNRLAEEDLSETRTAGGVTGDWLPRCRLTVERKVGEDGEFRFGRTDSLSLSLSRVVRIADELRDLESFQRSDSHLPPGYEPRRGDVLEDRDGLRFRIRGFSLTGDGLELEGLNQPLTLYLSPSGLRDRFVTLVERRR